MPASGPVYQPTTVTYEQQNDWTPISQLSQSLFGNGSGRTRCIQWTLLVIGLLTLAAGLIMIITGSIDFRDTQEHEEETGTTTQSEEKSAGDIVIVVGGTVLLLLSVLFLGLYARMMWRRGGCPCFPNKEQRLARQLDNQVGNGQWRIMKVESVIPRIPSIASIKRKVSTSSARLQAPLAGIEEITPSLRSSFASVYYNNTTPYESMLSVNSAGSDSN
ncbi:hypothetical protein C0J52_14189 [Blattella germanica]|nr:hypothetical protein C0J52_14189 [Blattella germanica]